RKRKADFLARKSGAAGRIHPHDQRLDFLFFQSGINLLGYAATGGDTRPRFAAHDFTGNSNDANPIALRLYRVRGDEIIISDGFETVRRRLLIRAHLAGDIASKSYAVADLVDQL